MAYDAHFYLASSNDEIFNGVHSNDIIIRTDDPTQHIFLGPFPSGIASNCVLQITNNNIITGADILPTSNQVFNIGSPSNIFNVVNLNTVQFGNNGNLNVNNAGQLVFSSISMNSQGIVQCNQTNFSTSLCNIYAVSNNVGIANSNPLFQLDINGDVNFTGILRQGGQPYINSQWSTGTSSNYIFITQCNVSIGSSNPSEQLDILKNTKVGSNLYVLNELAVGGSNPTEQLDILKNAKVGSNLYVLNELAVGKSNPSEQLDVLNNTKIGGQLFVFSNICIGGRSNPSEMLDVDGNIKVKQHAYIGCNLGVNTSNPQYTVDINGDINIVGRVFKNGQEFFLQTTACNAWLTYSNAISSSNIYFDTGYIGCGSSNPSEVLDVFGNTKVRDNLYVLCNLGVNMSNPQYTADINGDINFTGGLFKNGQAYMTACNTWLTCSNSSNIYFDAGYIGCGYSNPSEQLDVLYNTKIGCNLYVLSNVCIGYGSNPVAALEVGGNVVLHSDLNVMGNYFQNGVLFTGGGGSSNSQWNGPFSNIYSASNINYLGRVGICNYTPLAALHVGGDVRIDGALSFSKSLSFGGLKITHANGTGTTNVNTYLTAPGLSNQPLGIELYTNQQYISFTEGHNGFEVANFMSNICTFYSDIVYIFNDFGVGSSNPSEQLDVSSNTKIGSNLYVLNNFAVGGSNPTEQIDISRNMKIGSNLYVLSNVCIGYGSNPSAALEVGGQVILHSDLNVIGNYLQNGVLFSGGGGGGTGSNSQWNGPYSNAYSPSNINYFGRVGICNNTPLATLHVGGDVRIDGGLTFTNTLSFGGIKIKPSLIQGTQNGTTFMPVQGLSNLTLGTQLYTDKNYISLTQGSNANELAIFTSSNTVINSSNLVANNFIASSLKIGGYTNNTFNTFNNFAFSNETNGVNIFTYSNNPQNYVKFSACNYTMFSVDGSGNGIFGGSVSASNGTFTGTLTATSKLFDIPHPDPNKKNMRLRHSCVESANRGDTIYSTKITTKYFDEQFDIILPDYWLYLNENPRVFISYDSCDEYSQCCAKVDGSDIKGRCQVPGLYNLLVIGTRKDVDAYTAFDNMGGVEYYKNNSI